MTISYATAIKNERLKAVRDAVDAGSGAGLRRIYGGVRPATCGSVDSYTLLAELTFSDPCAGDPSNGVLTHSPITAEDSAPADGVATWFRDVDSDGECVMDGSVGTSGSDMNLNSTAISTGIQVSCPSSSITHG